MKFRSKQPSIELTRYHLFVIRWIESVDPVSDLCLTNQIYSLLLNAFELKEIAEVQNTTLKCFFKVAKRKLAPGRWRMKGNEKRPRGCKYPTPPCALAKILPETTVRAYFSQIENDSPTTNTFLTFSTNTLCPCMYTHGES